jgi:putative CocE/NonD family hydrolase
MIKILINAVLISGLLVLAGGCGDKEDPAKEYASPADTAAVAGNAGDSAPGVRISRFGEYQGYSEERFTEWVRESQYITVRDGTRLAVDIVRPAIDGVAVNEAFPVLWTHSRYHRNQDTQVRHFAEITGKAEIGSSPEIPGLKDGVITYVDNSATLRRLVKHGYVVVAVGVRGSGASYGRYEGLFSPNETKDAYDIMDWLVGQPWCDGNLGMFGASYLGITQFMAASTGHPALKALMPNVAVFDMYDAFYTGGIYRENMFEHWGQLTRNLDRHFPATAVDEDADGSMLAAAIREHEGNWDVNEQFGSARYRDHDTESFAWARFGPTAVLDAINSSGVAIYHWGGWYDLFSMDAGLWVVNYTGPDKLGMGPWPHAAYTEVVGEERARVDAAEHHRWFDYWLKDIDNGIMEEPAINYAITDIPGEKWHWETSDKWEPETVSRQTLYFADGPSGSVSSPNDGLLGTEAPSEPGFDEYAIDLTTTTGTASRWDNAVGQGVMSYPDMSENDEKSLSFTTPPLEKDVTMVGHPVVTLFVSSTTTDGDFYALLEEVDSEGYSHYITEGMLRASHRATMAAPWSNLGLPWQRSFKGDLEPLVPGEVVELRFDLLPAAHLFNKGNRIRVTVMGADRDNTESPPSSESELGTLIRLWRGGERKSGIELPLVDGVTGI